MIWAILYCSIAALLGVAAIRLGTWHGRQQERLEQRLHAQKRCNDGGLTNPFPMLCPCMCQGTLQSDGRNKNDNLTFLLCNQCKCTYVANDAPEKMESRWKLS